MQEFISIGFGAFCNRGSRNASVLRIYVSLHKIHKVKKEYEYNMTWNINTDNKVYFSSANADVKRNSRLLSKTHSGFTQAASVTKLKDTKAAVMDHLEHMELNSPAKLFDMAADALRQIREEKGSYDYEDVVNTAADVYAKLYAEIEKRYQNASVPYHGTDGRSIAKEDEIAWLEQAYETKIAWEQTNAKIAAQREQFLGHTAKVPQRGSAQIAEDFYAARKRYMEAMGMK